METARMLKISFHTLRRWKATVEYHRTKDILHVMKLRGYRNIKNTLVYTQLINGDAEDAYVCKAARTVEQAAELIEAGFEYVCEMEGFSVSVNSRAGVAVLSKPWCSGWHLKCRFYSPKEERGDAYTISTEKTYRKISRLSFIMLKDAVQCRMNA